MTEKTPALELSLLTMQCLFQTNHGERCRCLSARLPLHLSRSRKANHSAAFRSQMRQIGALRAFAQASVTYFMGNPMLKIIFSC